MPPPPSTHILQEVLAILPQPPRSQRRTRYQGDDRAASLTEMTEADARGVRELYAALSELDAHVRSGASIAQALAGFDVDRTLTLARGLGTGEVTPSVELRYALHDVRGGALASLALVARHQQLHPDFADDRSVRILTADHLKVMRNALLGVDDARREADRAPQPHPVERLVSTLERVASARVHVTVDCQYRNAVTTSCLELGALDRAALNLLNNAVRHSLSDTVHVWLMPVDARDGSDLRIVVSNPIDEAHAKTLRARFGDDLSRLFVESFSTTGSGEGLGICAEFVTSAYGLVTLPDAARAGLLGARLVQDSFVAWMHWPAVA